MTKQEAMGYVLIALQEVGIKSIDNEDIKMLLRYMSDAIDEYTLEHAENTFDEFMDK